MTAKIIEQNWFAVCLEIAVLIVGIFLGMQATNWQEERKEKEEFKAVIKQLVLEAENNLLKLNYLLETKEPQNLLIIEAYNILRECKMGNGAEELFIQALQHTGGTRTPRITTDILNNVSTNASYMRFLDSEMLSILTSYKNTLAYGMTEMIFNEDSAYKNRPLNTTAVLAPKYDNGSARSITLELAVPFEIACENMGFRKLFFEYSSVLDASIEYMNEMKAETVVLLTALERLN